MTHEEGLEEARRLTGEAWNPYPSDHFYQALEFAKDDATKRYLILDRRQYMFPQFLQQEPQLELINKILSGWVFRVQ